METVQQNGRFTLFSSKFHSNIYFILFGPIPAYNYRSNETDKVLKNFISKSKQTLLFKPHFLTKNIFSTFLYFQEFSLSLDLQPCCNNNLKYNY